MARIRSVHPGLFTDEAFVSLSYAAKVLWIGLWCESDDNGVFEWKPVQIMIRLMPGRECVEPLMEELELGNQIRRFEIGGRQYGAVRNFCRYQRPKKPKIRWIIPPELRTYVGLNTNSSELNNDEDASSSEPGGNRWGTGGEIPQQREEGGGRREEEGGKKERSFADANDARGRASVRPEDWPVDYREQFWMLYPNKVGKPKALGKLDGIAKRGGVMWADLMAGLRRYIAEKPQDRPWCNPETWLNQERWADQPASVLPLGHPKREAWDDDPIYRNVL